MAFTLVWTVRQLADKMSDEISDTISCRDAGACDACSQSRSKEVLIMIERHCLVAALLSVGVGLIAAERDANAGDYVWARTNWGSSNINRPYSSMSNGYGGYYVPRNAYGNNYEGRRFTNPNGFIVPTQPRRYR